MPGGLRYVALGDSAAQGIGASTPEQGYVSLIAEHLRLSSGKPIEIINLSHSGARIRDVVQEQLPRLAGLHADVITVGVGGNDIGAWNQADFAASAAALCAGLPSRGTVVADLPYFMHEPLETYARTASAILIKECKARGITIAPLHAAMQASGWKGMFTHFAADWFHPNNSGHQLWADAFWQAINVPGK